MNQQVAVYDPRQQAPVPSFTMSELERVALAIAKGGLFGSGDPNAVLTLCMVAQAEGKHPAQVMQDYDIIKGKPAKKAQAMLRDFLSSGGRVAWNRLDDECADATFSHPAGGEVTINWTMARAQKAQLNGDNWKKYPRSMLRSRVVSEGVRTVFPGATSGMYVPEEVADFDDTPSGNTPPTPQAKRARDLKADEPKQIEAASDYSATLVQLESVCGPGEADALAEAWQGIGKDARKALADELPRLKSLCEALPEAEPEPDEPHPAAAKADEIIAEINASISTLDVTSIVARHQADIAAMPDELGVKIEVAADKRRSVIEAKRKGPAELQNEGVEG